MKAVNCTAAELAVVDRDEPVPGKGQVLIDVLRCGICGSDLHARHHCDELADTTAEMGYEGMMRSDQDVVLGHEFCGEVVEHGPGTRKKLATGTPVVALPLLRRAGGVHPIGLSAAAPGAYAERLLVEESLAIAVPNGLAPDVAALTEPMAVGWHAVRRGEVKKRTVAIVIGCSARSVCAVIRMLKASGVRNVIASDFRRAPGTGPALRQPTPSSTRPSRSSLRRRRTDDGDLASGHPDAYRAWPAEPAMEKSRTADRGGGEPIWRAAERTRVRVLKSRGDRSRSVRRPRPGSTGSSPARRCSRRVVVVSV